MRRPGIPTILLVFSVMLFLAEPAPAMNCSQWTRLRDAHKDQAVARMIDNAVTGPGVRQYGVNRNAIGRCLDAQKQNIAYDFNDTCADSNRAGMQEIANIFKHYIWSCAG